MPLFRHGNVIVVVPHVMWEVVFHCLRDFSFSYGGFLKSGVDQEQQEAHNNRVHFIHWNGMLAF